MHILDWVSSVLVGQQCVGLTPAGFIKVYLDTMNSADKHSTIREFIQSIWIGGDVCLFRNESENQTNTVHHAKGIQFVQVH